MYQQPRREPELDLEQMLQKAKDFFRRFGGGWSGGPIAYIVWGILGVAFIIWMATGIFTVDPGDQAVKRTFGKFSSFVDEGLHWHWPTPIGTTRVLPVQETRSMELGFRTLEAGATPFQLESRMITGDLNVLEVPLVIQYRIADSEAFLFNVDDPGEPGREIFQGSPEGRTLKDVTEAALRRVVGQRPVDDPIIERRAEVEADTKDAIQEILDRYGTGIQILSVTLQDVVPPSEVKPAFDDVLKARQEKDTAINLGEAFREEQIPTAEGQAKRITEQAEAFKQERINIATGEAARFDLVLREYLSSKDVTRQRLYLEAMEEILPGITKIVVSPEAGGAIILNTSGEPIVPVPGVSSFAPTPTPAP